MSNCLVQVIRSDGEPGPSYGPYSYCDAFDVLMAVLKKGDSTENGPIEITDDVADAISLDGCWWRRLYHPK